ncbi:MAG: hypothetical protein HOW73_20355 [Polyangiaceae bacterium]|nr:hypothetical protein [Polyangiaceae bacterium]
MTPAEWTLAALLFVAPPGRHEKAPWADPSPEYAVARYQKIADAIVSRCGEDRSCAALLVSIAANESLAARDADEGMNTNAPACYRKGKYATRCDGGLSVSVFQVRAFGVDEHGQRITLRRLHTDRNLAAWQALRVARSSLARCKHLKPERRLSGLSGSCIDRDGPWNRHYRTWIRLRSWEPKVEKPEADS